MKNLLIAFALFCFGAAVYADEFPEAATSPTADELKQFLEGKIYTTKHASGAAVRYDFRANGFIFVNVNTGANLSGKWSVKDGQICTEIRGDAQCSDVRMSKSVLVLKRSNGEIISFTPA